MNPRLGAAGLPLAAAVALAAAGCSSRYVDLRAYPAHPDQQQLEDDVVVSRQHNVRTSVAYARPGDLEERFPPVTDRETSGNPFLFRPPLADAKFAAFRVHVFNESDVDAEVNLDKIVLRDHLGQEYRPWTQERLMNYWLGRVTIKLGDPVTWTGQMRALQRREEKGRSVVETVFRGGRIPARSEYTGYLVFDDLEESGKGELRWYQTNTFRFLAFLAFAPAGLAISNSFPASPITMAAAGALGVYVTDRIWGPPTSLKIGHYQILIDVAMRDSRHGRPVGVSLLEFNFDQVAVRESATDEEALKAWRKPVE